jgi:hypothetical protein
MKRTSAQITTSLRRRFGDIRDSTAKLTVGDA